MRILLPRIRLRLPRFDLRAQIALLGIGGVLLLGIISAAGSRTQARFQEAADGSIELKAHIAAVAGGLLAARQVETDFLLRRQEKLIGQRQDLLARAAERLAAVERLVAPLLADDPLKRAESIRAGLNNYTTRFQNVAAAQRTLGFTENEGLQGQLRQAVHAVEKRLSEFDQPRLAVLMLQMRRHEKDFMLRGDEKYGDELGKRVAEFAPLLADSSLVPEVKAEIDGLIKAYEARFMAYMVGASTLKEEADDLAAIYARLQPVVVEVEQTAEANAERAQAEILASRQWTAQLMWWAIGLTVACAGALSWWVGRRTSGPLKHMAAAMERLASGDLEVSVPRLARRDEIGAIARAFAVFHAKMVENGELTAAQAETRSRGEAERRQAMLALADQLEAEVGHAVEVLSQAAADMQANVGRVSGAVEETRGRATAVADASEQASANVQMVATASEELTTSLANVAAQVARSTEVARRAAADAGRTDETIRDLTGAASRIGDVVGLISAIAAQTNLLALNATIEAARAGEAGRGFAVVASEVKTLASQTAKATDDIRAQIEAIQTVIEDAVRAVHAIGATVGEMDEIASAISSTVQQQQSATQHIGGNVVLAARGTQNVAANIVGVGKDAEEAAEAAQGALAAAEGVAHRAAELQAMMRRVVTQLRAA